MVILGKMVWLGLIEVVEVEQKLEVYMWKCGIDCFRHRKSCGTQETNVTGME